MKMIYAPWSAEQVAALNAFQASGRFHPFTCNSGHVLVAYEDGWHCPDESCGYRQNWAHECMADSSVVDALDLSRTRLVRRAQEDILLSPDCMQVVDAIFYSTNAEDCPKCRLLINQPNGVFSPWICGCVRPLSPPVRQICAVLHTDGEGSPIPCPDGSSLEAAGAPQKEKGQERPGGPPPPGSRREQLPDHLLALMEIPRYISTACEMAAMAWIAIGAHEEHADELIAWEKRLHRRCRLNNKFTGRLCECDCHQEPDEREEVVLQESLE